MNPNLNRGLAHGFVPPFGHRDEKMVENLSQKLCDRWWRTGTPGNSLMCKLVPMYRHLWAADAAYESLKSYLVARADEEPRIEYVLYDIESICACVARASTQIAGERLEYRSGHLITPAQETRNDEAAVERESAVIRQQRATGHRTYIVPFTGQL